jgi:uncharacterized protein (DUF3084 family)
MVELKKVEQLAEEPLERLSAQEKWALFFQSAADPGKLELVNRLLATEAGLAMAGATRIEITPEEKAYFQQMSRDKYQFDVWARKREIWEKDQEIAEKVQEIAEKNQEITEKDREIAGKVQEITEKNQEITEKVQKITEKDQELAEARQEIAELCRLLGK